MALTFWFVAVALVLIAAGLVTWAWLRARRRGLADRVPVANTWRLTSLPAYRRALARYTALFTAVAVALGGVLVVTALTAGRWTFQRVETPEKYNRDIVLCLDVSGSMKDYDAQVLDRYLEMLPGFQGERVGLMLWDSTAAQVFPLTDDYDFAGEQLTTVRDAMKGGSSATAIFAGTVGAPGASIIGDGLASCSLMFDGDQSDGRSRSIIFATDNQLNGTPLVTLPDAAKFANERHVRVYGLDANTADDTFADEFRVSVTQNGGQYYKLADPGAVKGIVDQVTSDQTSRMLGAPILLVSDRPAGWLIALLVLLAGFFVVAWRVRL